MVLHGRVDERAAQDGARVSTTPTPRARGTAAASFVSDRRALFSPPSPDAREPRQKRRGEPRPLPGQLCSRSMKIIRSVATESTLLARRTPAPARAGFEARSRNGPPGCCPGDSDAPRASSWAVLPGAPGHTPGQRHRHPDSWRCSASESRARSPTRRARGVRRARASMSRESFDGGIAGGPSRGAFRLLACLVGSSPCRARVRSHVTTPGPCARVRGERRRPLVAIRRAADSLTGASRC